MATFDSFGESVSSALQEAGSFLDRGPGAPGIQVVISGRPRRREYLRFDEESRRAGRTWLPVTLEYPFVYVGPVLSPGTGPCFECFGDRSYQHDDAAVITRAIHELYEVDSPNPPLYLPQHARTVAGLVLEVLERPSARVVTFDVAQNIVRAETVVPWHGCPRCSDPEFTLRRDAELARLVDALSPTTPGARS
ncbi:TOMM precursor leader peptide-binding protein [Oerskovia turbata]